MKPFTKEDAKRALKASGVSDGAVITPDWNDGNVQVVTLGGNRTLVNGTNPKGNATYTGKRPQEEEFEMKKEELKPFTTQDFKDVIAPGCEGEVKCFYVSDAQWEALPFTCPIPYIKKILGHYVYKTTGKIENNKIIVRYEDGEKVTGTIYPGRVGGKKFEVKKEYVNPGLYIGETQDIGVVRRPTEKSQYACDKCGNNMVHKARFDSVWADLLCTFCGNRMALKEVYQRGELPLKKEEKPTKTSRIGQVFLWKANFPMLLERLPGGKTSEIPTNSTFMIVDFEAGRYIMESPLGKFREYAKNMIEGYIARGDLKLAEVVLQKNKTEDKALKSIISAIDSSTDYPLRSERRLYGGVTTDTTCSAGFQFPNGDKFIIPDPPKEDGWKEVAHKEYDFFCAYVFSTLYDATSTRYVINEPNGFKINLEIKHKDGKIIADEYKKRSEAEVPKCLWYKKWEKELTYKANSPGSYPQAEHRPPEPKESGLWPEGNHPRRVIQEK